MSRVTFRRERDTHTHTQEIENKMASLYFLIKSASWRHRWRSMTSPTNSTMSVSFYFIPFTCTFRAVLAQFQDNFLISVYQGAFHWQCDSRAVPTPAPTFPNWISSCSKIAPELFGLNWNESNQSKPRCNGSETALISLVNSLRMLWTCQKIVSKIKLVSKQFAEYTEAALKLSWNCPETALKLLWNCSGTALKLQVNASGIR